MPPPAKIKKAENVFEELIKAMKAPVEFDLPSALKEWKLGYYIAIKRNVYLTKRRIEDDGIFCSCTPSSGSTVACDKDCQCGMLFSCCSSNCKCDNKCANKSFQHRPLKKTKLITTSPSVNHRAKGGRKKATCRSNEGLVFLLLQEFRNTIWLEEIPRRGTEVLELVQTLILQMIGCIL